MASMVMDGWMDIYRDRIQVHFLTYILWISIVLLLMIFTKAQFISSGIMRFQNGETMDDLDKLALNYDY